MLLVAASQRRLIAPAHFIVRQQLRRCLPGEVGSDARKAGSLTGLTPAAMSWIAKCIHAAFSPWIAPIRILVVDDDSGIRHFVEKVLVRGGHEVVLAVNGIEALREIERSSFALVITDVLMPGADGLEVIRSLRKRPGAPRIIAMSGGGGRNGPYLEVAATFGAMATIEKPFTVEQLSSAVRAAEA